MSIGGAARLRLARSRLPAFGGQLVSRAEKDIQGKASRPPEFSIALQNSYRDT